MTNGEQIVECGSGSGYATTPPSTPHPVRIYDYLLGGKDNYAVDRAAADRLVAALPNVREAALANRGFLVRAVQVMAQRGLAQFIDLGTGLPTSPNVHEVARRHQPGARVAYVDNDTTVAVFNRALLPRSAGIAAVERDLREPAAVLADNALTDVIDLAEPVGLLLVAVLHFVEPETAAGAVREYVEALAPGSMIAISAACAEDMQGAEVERIRDLYAASRTPFVFHTPDRFTALFDGLELCEPGIVEVSRWRHDGPDLSYAGMSFLAGVATKH